MSWEVSIIWLVIAIIICGVSTYCAIKRWRNKSKPDTDK